MGAVGLQVALLRGEPLADVVVTFRAGVDGASATRQINALADDFDLCPPPYYSPQMRIGTATRDALERMFGWKLRRAEVPGQPSTPPLYWWEEVSSPSRYPPGLQEVIESLGLSQPGVEDDGQWYEYR